ncbi:MAG: GerMN domain-containing protein [Acidothermus sp.]|nr:GerMN domain-containing protein [Acidothermus sp.]
MSRFRSNDGEWVRDAERALRDALAGEAATITPSTDGLARIRQRTAARPRLWPRWFAVAGTAAATAAVVAIAVLASQARSGHEPGTPLGGGETPSQTETTPASPSSGSPSSTPSASAATYTVTLYYVGVRPDPRQLLFEERVQRPVPAGKAVIRDAVTALLETTPSDPDYTSYWPQGTTLTGATVHDTTAIIELSMPETSPSTTPSEVPASPAPPAGLGAISVQQLLYTIHAAAPKVTSMELRINGSDVTTLWGDTISEPVALAPAMEVFSHVWITSPTEGQVIAASGSGPTPVRITGKAIVFEGTVNWDVLRGDQVVARGAAQTVGAPEQGDWSVTVPLEPGSYTIRAYEISAKDGSITYLDDKTITIQAATPTS